MNPAESISSLYLRFNGFFQLPEFTIFRTSAHQHVDILALRPPGGVDYAINRKGERVPLPLDDKLFAAIEKLGVAKPTEKVLGAVGEVKANKSVEEDASENLKAVEPFFGRVDGIVRFNFSGKFGEPRVETDETGKFIGVGVSYALHWIRGRINRMKNDLEVNKGGSWTLSEGFLATILLLLQYEESD